MLLEKYCFETWYLFSERNFTLIFSLSVHKCINGNNNEKYCLFYRFFNLFIFYFFSLHHSIIHSRVVYASCSSSKLYFIKIIIWNRVDKNENKKKIASNNRAFLGNWELENVFAFYLWNFNQRHWEIEQYWFDLLICRFLQLVQYYIHLLYLFAWLMNKCVSLNDW